MPKVKGVIGKIFKEAQVTKDFKRRQFVITTCTEMGRMEHISFELFQDHCKMADSFKEGDKVIVDYNLKGRKWTDSEDVEKYFNTLQAWKIIPDTTADDY